jgi:DNA-binding transcriptional ArsR family regulator
MSMPDNDPQTPVFEALADPTRRAILRLLGQQSCSVQEIAAEFPISRPAISKHLRVLRDAGLVTERQQGRRHYHELCTGPLEDTIATLRSLCGGDRATDEADAPVVERTQVDDNWRCW